jgi:peptidoglycan/xylan/chitin deacetylase (PgdA/CDA1 family)
MFSCDLDSFDFKAAKPKQIIETVMTKVNKLRKGIILMHDFQKYTAEALPTLLGRLKAGGYKGRANESQGAGRDARAI